MALGSRRRVVDRGLLNVEKQWSDTWLVIHLLLVSHFLHTSLVLKN